MDQYPEQSGSTGGEIYLLVRIDDGERRPYVPFSGQCGCGCGGSPGDCCCSAD